jgi:hypothetical protein
MNTNERLLSNLKALAGAGTLPRSQCGMRLMSTLRPLLAAGIVAEERSGAGRQLIIKDLTAFREFVRDTFPMEDTTPSMPSRLVGIRRFRNTKAYRADGVDVIRVRAFSSGILRKHGDFVDVHSATESHGVFSFRLAADYTLHGCIALVENPTVFDFFERLNLALPFVIYGQGRISTNALRWLADQDDDAFSLIHLPDYDPVGLSEFERIRKRLGCRAQLYVPRNLGDLFRQFSNRELLKKPKSQRLLARLRTSNISEVQVVVRLIDSHNAGLEQEVLIH